MTFRAIALAGLALHACHCLAASQPPVSEEDTREETAAFWRFYASPLTVHVSSSPDHRAVYSLGVERQYPSGFLVGAAAFRNSFGQPSAYAYGGYRFDAPFSSVPELFFQLSAGVLYGYKEPYENKVPFNHHGVFARCRRRHRLGVLARVLGADQTFSATRRSCFSCPSICAEPIVERNHARAGTPVESGRPRDSRKRASPVAASLPACYLGALAFESAH
jgi:hypothetical protein